MRVYHFLNSKFALENLKHKRLKVSQVMTLNDPFELLGVDLSDSVLRRAMEITKRQLAARKGLICFSRNWQNPVQWAHYADNHKGVCLGFDIPDKILYEVIYVNKRMNMVEPKSESERLRILTTKFKHWSYEEESRLFVDLEEPEEALNFESFSEKIKIKQVIIGAASIVTKDQVIKSYGNCIDLEIIKARAAFKSFKIVKDQRFTEHSW